PAVHKSATENRAPWFHGWRQWPRLRQPSPMTPDRDKAARELLAFYQEAGVDALLGETPIDRFAAPPAGAAPRPPARRGGGGGGGAAQARGESRGAAADPRRLRRLRAESHRHPPRVRRRQ